MYFQSLLWIGIPNIFLISALLFTVGALTRSHTALSMAVLPLVIGFSLSLIMQLSSGVHVQTVLLDPFGYAAVRAEIRYWTPSQINSMLLPTGGYLLWDRIVWTGIGFALLTGCSLAFRFSSQNTLLQRSSRTPILSDGNMGIDIPDQLALIEVPTISKRWSLGYSFSSCMTITLFHLRRLVLSYPFIIMSVVTAFDVIMVAVVSSHSMMPT
jgi:hypothetical protein